MAITFRVASLVTNILAAFQESSWAIAITCLTCPFPVTSLASYMVIEEASFLVAMSYLAIKVTYLIVKAPS